MEGDCLHNSTWSRAAKQSASRCGIDLIDGEQLATRVVAVGLTIEDTLRASGKRATTLHGALMETAVAIAGS